MSEQDLDLEKYFLPIEWSEMSQLQKTRAQNILENYRTMKSCGFQPQEPYFIKDYKKRKEEDIARKAKFTPPPTKKVFRVNEGASTSGSCSGAILKSVAPNSNASAPRLNSSAASLNSSAASLKSGAPSLNASAPSLKLGPPNSKSAVPIWKKSSRNSTDVQPPAALSVRLDIEKYFSDEEWGRKTQEERDALRAELETYSLNRTIGKDAEAPSFVVAYKERKIKQLQETREKILSTVGKGMKFKKSSKPTRNAESGNQQVNSDTNENKSCNVNNEETSQELVQVVGSSAKVSKNTNKPKKLKSKSNNQPNSTKNLKKKSNPEPPKEIFQVNNSATISKTPKIPKTAKNKSNPGTSRVIDSATALKISAILKQIKLYKLNNEPAISKTLKIRSKPDTSGEIVRVNNSQTVSKTSEIPKKLKNKSNNGPAIPKKLKIKSNPRTSGEVVRVDDGVTVSKSPAVPKKPNNEPKKSNNEHALPKKLITKSNPVTSQENVQVSDESSVFKIPAVPTKLKTKPSSAATNSSKQAGTARSEKSSGVGAPKIVNNRKKIKEQRAKINKEKQKKEEEEIYRKSLDGYVWGEFFDQIDSITYEETDDLCFTEVEINLSHAIYQATRTFVLFPSASDEVDEESKKDTDKKKNDGEEKKKSKVKTSGNSQTAEVSSSSNTPDSPVLESTAQVKSSDQPKNENVGLKRRYPKRSVPVKNYAEPENINMDDFVFCDVCGREWFKQCNVHGKMINIPDIPVDRKKAGDNYAKETTPRILGVAQSKIVNAGRGVWTRDMIKTQVQFGPYKGRTGKGNPKDPNYAWQLREMAGGLNYVDASDERYSNWMRYVNCARNMDEMNLMAFQFEGAIYYRTFRLVAPHEELFVFYGEQFGSSLGIDVKNFKNPVPTNEKDVSFYCAECNSVFTSPLYLEQHEMTCLLGLGPRKRAKLPASTENVLSSSDIENRLSLTNNTNVQKPHLLSVDGQTEKQLDAGNTSNDGQSTTNVSQQLEVNVSGKKGVRCHLCNRIYSNMYKLNEHIKRIHDNIRPYQCDVTDCGAYFARKYDLDRHVNSVHLKVRLFKCNICDYKCSTDYNLKRHMNGVHLNVRAYECKLCNKTFTPVHHLKRHMNIVHLKIRAYECEICGEKFTHPYSLKYHMASVHLNKVYECKICGKTCSKNSNLKSHMNSVHLKIKPFECEICGETFTQNGNLKRHMIRAHTT